MAKRYLVWVTIEAVDEETQESESLDSPAVIPDVPGIEGGPAAGFGTYNEAFDWAVRLQAVGETMATLDKCRR